MHILQLIDVKILFFLQGIRCDALTYFFSLFIKLEFWHVVALVLIFFYFIETKKLRAPIISYLLAWNGAHYAFSVLKVYFHRPRPFLTVHGLMPIMTPRGFSFPSGHATTSMAMAVVLGCYFPRARYLVLVIAFLTGLSRNYLGVHYPSDVLAGFILGSMVGMLSLIVEKIIFEINKVYA